MSLQALGTFDDDLLAFVQRKPAQTNVTHIEETGDRDTLLGMIGALARLAEISIQNPAKAAENIVNGAEQLGVTLSRRTVQNHLNRVNDSPIEKPLLTRECNTLLIIIGALAKLANIPIPSPPDTAERIVKVAEQLGVALSQRAVQDHLGRVPETLRNKAT